MDELSYKNAEGLTVYTSQYYRNRGTCCKTNCLHCPFGTTLRNLGLRLETIERAKIKLAQGIVDDARPSSSGASGMLLAGAFGAVKKTILDANNLSEYVFIFLKDELCGVAHTSAKQVKELFLKEHFRDQGLDKETVQSFL